MGNLPFRVLVGKPSTQPCHDLELAEGGAREGCSQREASFAVFHSEVT